MKKNVFKLCSKFLEFFAVLFIILFLIHYYIDRIVISKLKEIDKFKRYYLLHESWVRLYQEKIKVKEFFKKNNINKVAIYGNGKIGKTFYKELKNSEFEVCYIIDRDAEIYIEDIPVLGLKNRLPEVDAIIVTIPEQMPKIKKDLEKICNYPILSLETIIYGSREY